MEKQLRQTRDDVVELRCYKEYAKDGNSISFVVTKVAKFGHAIYDWEYSEDGFDAQKHSKWLDLTVKRTLTSINTENDSLSAAQHQARGKWYFENGHMRLDHQALSSVIERENSKHKSAKKTTLHFLKADLKEEFKRFKVKMI